MFCPQCKSEYQPEFIRCADCDVAVVDFLPESEPYEDGPPTEDLDYIPIASAPGALEEGQMVSFLQANGIDARAVGQELRKIYGINIEAMGAARILVPRKDAVLARELLDKAERGELEIEASDSDE